MARSHSGFAPCTHSQPESPPRRRMLPQQSIPGSTACCPQCVWRLSLHVRAFSQWLRNAFICPSPLFAVRTSRVWSEGWLAVGLHGRYAECLATLAARSLRGAWGLPAGCLRVACGLLAGSACRPAGRPAGSSRIFFMMRARPSFGSRVGAIIIILIVNIITLMIIRIMIVL